MSTPFSKTFITEFKKAVAAEPSPIPDDLIPSHIRYINKELEFSAIVKSYGNTSVGSNVMPIVMSTEETADSPTRYNLLLISYLGRQGIRKPSFYIEAITNSEFFGHELLLNSNITYFLIYKNKSSYYVFHYDYAEQTAEQVELKPNFQLPQFASIFSNAEVINSSRNIRSDLEDVIQTIWNSMGCGSDKRTVFIILTWILLTNDDIEFCNINGKSYSLTQYFAFLWEHSQQSIAGTADQSEAEAIENIDGWTLVEAFKRVITRKIKHDSEQSLSVQRQINKFSETIAAIQNKQTKSAALLLADQMYKDILIPYGKDIDICKLAFELENRWNNRTNGNQVAAKGQVYTHIMMKNLIIRIISENITKSSTCYDPTCGTGGFCESFYKYCERHDLTDITAYGNEIDNDCSNLAWINGLASKSDVRIFNLDCFDPEIKHELILKNSVDFLLMNPPFGMNKGKFLGMPSGFSWEEDAMPGRSIKPTEWTFCRYNMETYLKIDGWFAFVIPTNCLSEHKSNTYDKTRMLEECEIWFVIKIRDDIFTPQAAKACCIVVGRYLNGRRTREEIATWKTKCIDFSEDGGEIKRKKGEVEYNQQDIERLWYERILDNKELEGINVATGGEESALMSVLYSCNEVGKEYYKEVVLSPTENWIYTKNDFGDPLPGKIYLLRIIEDNRHEVITNNMDDVERMRVNIDLMNDERCDMRKIKLMDLFEYVGRGKRAVKGNEEGPYPLISSSKKNNGVVGHTSTYTFGKSEDDVHVTIAVDGNAGICFVQRGLFDCTSHTHVLKFKPEYKYIECDESELFKCTAYIGWKLINKYDWKFEFNMSRLMNEVIELPFNRQTDMIEMDLMEMVNFETLKFIQTGEYVDMGSQYCIDDITAE